MEKLREFLAMGGYATYVWPAFGVALGVLAMIAYFSHRALRRYEGELARLEREAEAAKPSERAARDISPRDITRGDLP